MRKRAAVVTFPLSVFETADTKEDLEDWLLSQDPDFVKFCKKDEEGKTGRSSRQRQGLAVTQKRAMYQVTFLPDAEAICTLIQRIPQCENKGDT